MTPSLRVRLSLLSLSRTYRSLYIILYYIIAQAIHPWQSIRSTDRKPRGDLA